MASTGIDEGLSRRRVRSENIIDDKHGEKCRSFRGARATDSPYPLGDCSAQSLSQPKSLKRNVFAFSEMVRTVSSAKPSSPA